MKIFIEELEIAFLKAINYLENKGIKELVLKDDYYWYIQKEQCYNIFTKPDIKQFTIGQLTWDIESIVKSARDEEDDYILAYHLVWISTLMRALGEENLDQEQNNSSGEKVFESSMKQTEYTKISIEKIKIVFLKVMRLVREDGIKEYTLSNDHYWYIPKEQLYVPEVEPNLEELKIGILSSDIEKMRRIANNKEAISGDFMWLSAIMRALGEEIPI